MNGTMEQWYRILLAPDADTGGGGGGEGAPAESGATETSSEPSSQPEGQGQRGAAPWDKELEEMGLTDPRFSEYMRTKQQPRMTQLEQQVAQIQGLIPQEVASQFDTPTGAYEAAANLMQGLNTDPAGTIQQLMQLFELDPQAVFALQQAAGNDPAAQQAIQAAAQAAENQPPAEPEQIDPRAQWIDQQMQQQIEQQQEVAYEAHLADLAKQIPGFNPKLYTHALVLSQGDPNLALEMYRTDYHGLAHETAAPPSPTLGQAAGVAPAEAPQHSSLKDAIHGYLQDQKQLSNSVG